MGAFFSLLRTTYDSITLLLSSISSTNATFASVLVRLSTPQLPAPDPTPSFWQDRPIYPDLVNIHSPQLPSTADIVIIGSGISGASIAYTILNECRTLNVSRKVTILEGRTICSGATGRNGGHIKVVPHVEYAKLKERFGIVKATKILAFMRMHQELLIDVAKKEGYECAEAREVMTVDAFMEEGTLGKVQAMLEVLIADLPGVAEEVKVLDAESAQKELGLSSHCVGAITYPSGAIWPYRFVTSVYHTLLSQFPDSFSIETGTMVESVKPASDTDTPFLLKTSRGDISASHVVHASDAFAPCLIPALKGKLFPIRGHMSAQRPGKEFPRKNGKVSWSIVGKSDFEYITQRPGVLDADDGMGGEMMVGGGSSRADDGNVGEVGQWGDDRTDYAIGAYLGGLLPMVFNTKNWGEDADGSRVKALWTGTMGFTADMLPLVGKLESSLTQRLVPKRKLAEDQGTENSMPGPAEWTSAGFNGSGMTLTWLCGVATGLMVLGREDVDFSGGVGRPKGKIADWLPEEFVCTKERIARSSIYQFAKLV